ncbi:MAG: MOSC domain-containing protein [Herpetosiphon sp.]
MIRIHTLLIGQPQSRTDERGTWSSAIFRQPTVEPVMLEQRGLIGDQVADTVNHGALDQAVCCHPIAHYDYWNTAYGIEASDRRLGPGSVGENWTLTDATEQDLFIGDIFTVGNAVVQVAGPRYPCSKQERKVQLPNFLRRTKETMRTGIYLRVITPGTVQVGNEWKLEHRPNPDISVHDINRCIHHTYDPAFAARALAVPELAPGWKSMFDARAKQSREA